MRTFKGSVCSWRDVNELRKIFNKLWLEEQQHTSYCVTVFICGGPATSLASDRVLGPGFRESSSLIHWWNTLCCYQQNFNNSTDQLRPRNHLTSLQLHIHRSAGTINMNRTYIRVRVCARMFVCVCVLLHKFTLIVSSFNSPDDVTLLHLIVCFSSVFKSTSRFYSETRKWSLKSSPRLVLPSK